MNEKLQQKLSMLETAIGIQKDNLERGYMHGMLNGMIYAHAIFADCEPKYQRGVYRKPGRIKVRHKSRQVKPRQ